MFLQTRFVYKRGLNGYEQGHANNFLLQAKTYLTTYHWDMDQALQAFYEDEDDDTPGARAMPAPGQEDSYTGPRTLDGRPVPYSSGATASSSSQAPKKSTGGSKLRTLGDLSGQDDEDHQDDEAKRRSLFAGGEKSGLAVQDPSQAPRDLVRDIIEKARRYVTAFARLPQSVILNGANIMCY